MNKPKWDLLKTLKKSLILYCNVYTRDRHILISFKTITRE